MTVSPAGRLAWWLAPAAIGLAVAGWSAVVMHEHLHGVLFTAGLIVAGLDLMVVGGWMHRRMTAVDAGAGGTMCPQCGHDRRAVPTAPCPECGSRRPPTHLHPGRWAALGVGLVVAGIVLLLLALTLGGIVASPAVWQVDAGGGPHAVA